MAMKGHWWLGGAAMAALLLLPQSGDSCGPFIESMEFTTYHGLVPGDLASGHLGVVRPHFYRRELLLAYRAFSGLGGNNLPASEPSPQAENSSKVWLEARQSVPGAAHLDQVRTDRKLPGSDFEEYPNCLPGALQAAADTLHQRVARWGASSPQVAEWLRGQDQVFQNCSAGAVIPAPVTAPPDLAADRQYQIAAAEFYAEQYGKAEADFDRIAKQPESPWHEIAPYLAARACIRHATIGALTAKLQEADQRLAAIVHDPALAKWHAAAEEMRGFVRARTEPAQRLVELGEQLIKPDLGPQLERVLTDYTNIWDRMETAKDQPPVDRSDVARWIAEFQHGLPTNAPTRSTLPWLVASLAWAPPADPKNADLIRAAHAVPPDSAAYASVAYYGILRQIRAGEPDAARQWADDALSKAQSPATQNLLRAERLRLARNWAEFLRYATRKPVATDTFDGPDEVLADNDPRKESVAFDSDASTSFNQATPLSLWVDASGTNALPSNLRAQLAEAGWVRAVLLNDPASARILARRLGELKPELQPEMARYLGATDAAGAHFTAVFLLLRGPGFSPGIRAGFPRQTDVMKRDIFRDNWWSLSLGKPAPTPYDPPSGAHDALYDLYGAADDVPPDFLPKDQRAAGEADWHKLVENGGNAVNYLCSETIAWAKSHPQDPRVPQALHLAVEATHYGPSDKASSPLSKQAFDLLHRNYPNSEWAKQTKYWY
jgi:hypothetical protein